MKIYEENVEIFDQIEQHLTLLMNATKMLLELHGKSEYFVKEWNRISNDTLKNIEEEWKNAK